MAESECPKVTESFKTSGDIMMLSNKNIRTGTKARAGSRSPTPERPFKCPRTTRSEPNVPTPGTREDRENPEGMHLKEVLQEVEADPEGMHVKEVHKGGMQLKEAQQEGIVKQTHLEETQVKETQQEGIVKQTHLEETQVKETQQEGIVKQTHLEETQVKETQQDRMQEDERARASQGNGPALSPRSRRKSWRRSARLRRSFPALPYISFALSTDISPSLPEEERLEKLMESSMQQALLKLQESLQGTPGASLDSLPKQVETVQREWRRLALDIREQGQSRPSQTDAESVQAAMDQVRGSVHRLQTECGLWDSLLLRHRGKAEELARCVEQGRAEGVAVDASCVARSKQSQFILNKPDYHCVLLRQQTVLHDMELMVDTQCKMIRQVLSFQEQCHMVVKETSRRLALTAGFQVLPSSPVRNLLAGSNGFKHDPLTSDTAGHALFP